MSKFIILDEDNIETREFAVFEDMIFLDEEELKQYVESCEAKYETENFIPDSDMFDEFFDVESFRQDYDDDEWDSLCGQFNESVEDLLEKYNIYYEKISSSKYRLEGTYTNLRQFAAEYSNDLHQGNAGEPLHDFEDAVVIDIESGDDSFIIGRLSQ